MGQGQSRWAQTLQADLDPRPAQGLANPWVDTFILGFSGVPGSRADFVEIEELGRSKKALFRLCGAARGPTPAHAQGCRKRPSQKNSGHAEAEGCSRSSDQEI